MTDPTGERPVPPAPEPTGAPPESALAPTPPAAPAPAAPSRPAAALDLPGWTYVLAAAVGIIGSIALTVRRYLRIAA